MNAHERRIWTSPFTYIQVPTFTRPPEIDQRDCDKLSVINDYIIDRVSYDHARANNCKGGVQSPEVTLRRRQGVCMDYAALFERLARKEGYRVMSQHSDILNHAWNTVHLSGRWWIIDVTWNDATHLVGGEPLPDVARRDPDLRKQYFLTTLHEEDARRTARLISQTHHASDTKPVDYWRTLEATAIVARLQRAVARRNNLLNHPDALAQADKEISALNAKYQRIAAAHPIGLEYHLSFTLNPGLDP